MRIDYELFLRYLLSLEPSRPIDFARRGSPKNDWEKVMIVMKRAAIIFWGGKRSPVQVRPVAPKEIARKHPRVFFTIFAFAIAGRAYIPRPR